MIPHVVLCVYIYTSPSPGCYVYKYIYILSMVVISLTTYVDNENMSLTAPCASPQPKRGPRRLEK
jgi:hypothetical protein